MAKNKDFIGYAGFWRRFAATIIDCLILGLLGIGISFTLGTDPFSEEAKTGLQVVDRILTLGLSALYTILFWVSFNGATPGKKFVGIKIIKEGKEKIDYSTAIIRYVGYFVSTVPLFIGFLWMLLDRKKQTWHDKLAGTVVVKTSQKINAGLTVFATIFGLIILVGISAYPTVSRSIKDFSAHSLCLKQTQTQLATLVNSGTKDAQGRVWVKDYKDIQDFKGQIESYYRDCMKKEGASEEFINKNLIDEKSLLPTPYPLITPAPLSK